MNQFVKGILATVAIISAGLGVWEMGNRHLLPFQDHIDQDKAHILLHREGSHWADHPTVYKAYILDYRPEKSDFCTWWHFTDPDGFEIKIPQSQSVLWLASEFEIPEKYEVFDYRKASHVQSD